MTLISKLFRILADAFVDFFHADREVLEHLPSYYSFDQLILTPTTFNLEWIVNQCPEVYIPLFSNISLTTILHNGINVSFIPTRGPLYHYKLLMELVEVWNQLAKCASQLKMVSLVWKLKPHNLPWSYC